MLLSPKFHYPMDVDLPPSQRGPVRSVSTFLSHWKSVFQLLPFASPPLFLFAIRSWQLQRSGRRPAEGITVRLQTEEKV